MIVAVNFVPEEAMKKIVISNAVFPTSDVYLNFASEFQKTRPENSTS